MKCNHSSKSTSILRIHPNRTFRGVPGILDLHFLLIGFTDILLSKNDKIFIEMVNHKVVFNSMISSIFLNVFNPSVHVKRE